MRRKFIVAMLAVGSMGILFIPGPTQADTVKSFEGLLAAIKGEEGKIATASLTVCEGIKDIVYTIVLDDRGTRLATDLAGREVFVRGTVNERSALTIQEFLAVVHGIVSVKEDGEGKVSDIRIKSAEGEYRVTVDEAGKKLALEGGGKGVQLAGVYTVKEGEKWLTAKKHALLQTLVGSLEVEEDEEGNPRGVKLSVESETGEMTHPILYDKTGKQLAKDLAWEQVEISGLFYTKGKTKWLKVCTVKKAPEEPQAPDEEEGEEEEE
ncbi:MAG: hypothetical protein ACYTHM_21340 [Planctomycetota bacterium]|jgi:hypothetical protein